MLSFPPFRLDLDAERLWKEGRELHLRRKPFAILRYLVQNPHRLISQAELVEAVWGKVATSESLLRTHMRDLRTVIGQDVVETVVGRGYRLTCDVGHVHADMGPHGASPACQVGGNFIVGRDAELAALRAALGGAREQRRTTVFLAGEAGAGKSALLDGFLEETSARIPVLVGRGACVETYAAGQPLLALVDAIRTLCRGRGGEMVADVLARHAPTWLAQMPGLLGNNRLDELHRRAAGGTHARMSCELAEALEALSSQAPVILVLEDVHWADPFSAEVLSFLARRREAARCLLIGTYRPAEVSRGHPLSRVVGELVAHRQARSLELPGFELQEITAYLAHRFPGHRFSEDLADTLLQATGGNPLFLSLLVDDLEDQGLVARREEVWQLTASVQEVATRRPRRILRLIDAQLDRLSATEQLTLEAAGVLGRTFTAEAVAHALDDEPDVVDGLCETLAVDRKLLRSLGAERRADGTIRSAYSFRHEMFRHAAVDRVKIAKARAWHTGMPERREQAHCGRAQDTASEPALPRVVAVA